MNICIMESNLTPSSLRLLAPVNCSIRSICFLQRGSKLKLFLIYVQLGFSALLRNPNLKVYKMISSTYNILAAVIAQDYLLFRRDCSPLAFF
jgi:hypothetical protein